MDSGDQFFQQFSRERILSGGPPTKRAQRILFAIEGRTAYLADRSRRSMERYPLEESAREREMAFIDAFNLGKEPLIPPTIQDLERFAMDWKTLVPKNVDVQAALAYTFGQKYQFSAGSIPEIRNVLALDSAAVQRAYERFYDTPHDDIYAGLSGLSERGRWAWARVRTKLENLSPFWTVFTLTLTETIGAGILALPIALSSIGPLPGIGLLVLLGLINTLTVGYMAEASTRSSGVRYGGSFIGQMAAEYLGGAGSALLSGILLVYKSMVILALYIGLSTTLGDATGLSPQLWVLLLFGVGLYFVSRGSLDATVAAAMVIGVINIGLILILSALALPEVSLQNLSFVNLPFVSGQSFETSSLVLVFGVILVSLFGHVSVPMSARVVLKRDPGGGALIRGAMAGQIVTIGIYSIFVLTVNGAVAPEVMAAESSTALVPLASAVGPSIYLFGTIFVILCLGISTIHVSLGLFHQVQEWLPRYSGRSVTLPRRQGRLRLVQPADPAALPQISVVFLGIENGQASFRWDVESDSGTTRLQNTVEDSLDVAPFIVPHLKLEDDHSHLELEIYVAEVEPQVVHLRIKSNLTLLYVAEWDSLGLTMSDILTLPQEEREFVNWMLLSGRVGLNEVAAKLALAPQAAQDWLSGLVDRGFLQAIRAENTVIYEPQFAVARSRHLSPELAAAVAGAPVVTPATEAANQLASRRPLARQHIRAILFGERGRFVWGLLPVILGFLLTEWLLFTGNGSFSNLLGFVGVIAATVFAWMFPTLLLRASRLRGDIVPSVVYKFIGHPIVLAAVFLLALTGILVYGLFIWQEALIRVFALAVAALTVAVATYAWRRGAFAPRIVVQLREDIDQAGGANFTVMVGGQPLVVEAELFYADSQQRCLAATGDIPDFAALRKASFQIGAVRARELKVWTHQVNSDGESRSLPMSLEVVSGRKKRQFDMRSLGGQVLQRYDGEPILLNLTAQAAEKER